MITGPDGGSAGVTPGLCLRAAWADASRCLGGRGGRSGCCGHAPRVPCVETTGTAPDPERGKGHLVVSGPGWRSGPARWGRGVEPGVCPWGGLQGAHWGGALCLASCPSLVLWALRGLPCAALVSVRAPCPCGASLLPPGDAWAARGGRGAQGARRHHEALGCPGPGRSISSLPGVSSIHFPCNGQDGNCTWWGEEGHVCPFLLPGDQFV